MSGSPGSPHTAQTSRRVSRDLPSQPWSDPAARVLEALRVAPEQGLETAEARRRLATYGPNQLVRVPRTHLLILLADQFRSLLVGLLIGAAALAVLVGQWKEGAAIAVVLLINAAIGFITEVRAVRSMEALRRLGRTTARVRRDGRVQLLPADDLVPGDIVIIEGGDVVVTDLRLVHASKLQANESTLTGESVPVTKQAEPAPSDAHLAERRSMVFAGTAITRGSGEGVVVRTGRHTELGQISDLVATVEDERTPLERRLDRLGQRLLWVTLAAAVMVGLAGLIAGQDLFFTIEISIALAVASVPEGLPVITTIALARGVYRMAERNAVLRRLAAVETLGATTVILTDKTGTLTENQMTVRQVIVQSGAIEVTGEGLSLAGEFRHSADRVNPEADSLLRQAIEIGVLCNNSALDRNGGLGDPVEVALLVAGRKAGIPRDVLLERLPEVHEEAFDPDLKMMATVHKDLGRYRVAVKGAAEAILAASTRQATVDGTQPQTDETRAEWLGRTAQLSADGYRVLGLASKHVDDPDTDVYRDLTFVGLVCLLDPPRKEAGDALAACRASGIRVVMVTGDHPKTAEAVGRAVGLDSDRTAQAVAGSEIETVTALTDSERQGLLDATIFARVTPAQKLQLVALHQANHGVVAMTGDGVNDAPALKKADIGVAMGRRGTEVAREAADMVLRDDSLATIVVAIRQGRIIFENIRAFVMYLLSCNLSEILIVGLASTAGALPLLPLQILYLNLVTDVFPALALGMGQGDERVMVRPPRDPSEPILDRSRWTAIGTYGLLITIATLTAFGLARTWLGLDAREALTVSFLTLAFAQLWHVFNMRAPGSSWRDNEITRNPHVWGALLLCTTLLLASVHWDTAADVLSLQPLRFSGWTVVALASLVPFVAGQLARTGGTALWERFATRAT